jgi:glycosyltransferase involved in cell wall biosynthesis
MSINLKFLMNLKNNNLTNRMLPHAPISETMNLKKVCVIIPTYNNHKTLKRVIDGVLQYTTNIIVVNDGSTDSTSEIINSYSSIDSISISKNQGKGNALRLGFKKAIETGYHFAITIDSDGQHFPDDIPVFLEELDKNDTAILLIGSRNMNQDGVPKKSSFGNKFSNFWFWFETGIQLEDTQSGYRLYPLLHIPKKYVTKKFEFEIEVIVRSAWKGILVKNVPIKILYDPDERVTHFRPFKDFTRISILNTVLVLITLFYSKPRDFFRSFQKKKIKQFIKDEILESNDSTLVKSLSIALGVFIGIAPFWGFQTVLVIFLAVLFRWNKILAFTFSNISIPPMIPFIIFASLKAGSYFVNGNVLLDKNLEFTFETIKNHTTQYIIGSFVLATIAAVIFGFCSYFILSLSAKSKT